jgi:raffinose/stachyose/melibiose transport system permease protein
MDRYAVSFPLVHIVRYNVNTWQRARPTRIVLGYLLLLPSVVLVALFWWYPLLEVLYASFFDWDGLSPLEHFVGLANYRVLLFEDPYFWNAVKNTMIWSAMYVTVPVAIGLIAALMLNARIKGENLFKGILYLPSAISFAVVAFIWGWMYHPAGGLVNQMLRALNLGMLAQPWLASNVFVLPAINVASSWVHTGFALVVFLAGLRSIPDELIEAATIDGAGQWQVIRHILIPLLRPAFTVVLGWTLMLSVNVFDQINILTKGGPGRASEVLSIYLYVKTFLEHQAGMASAIGIVMFLLAAAGGILYVRQMISQEVTA